MNFAGVAGIMEAEQEVFILGSVAVAFFLFLLVTIRSAKFTDPSYISDHNKTALEKQNSKTEPRITDLTNIKRTSRAHKAEEREAPASSMKTVLPDLADSNILGVKSGTDEDFKIFRRPSSHKQKKYQETQKEDAVTNELQLIEQNMISLKNMFHNGHITRDVYVDETRTLYNQARALSEAS